MDIANLRISDPHLDWASLTVQLPPERIVDALRRKVRGAFRVKSVTPHNKGYAQAFELLDAEEDPLCMVEAGASHGWNLVTATGTQPNALVLDAVRLLAAQGAAAHAPLGLTPRLMSSAAISTSSLVWSKVPRKFQKTGRLCALLSSGTPHRAHPLRRF